MPVFALVKCDNLQWMAPIHSEDSKLGVVVFSHGLAGFRGTYSHLCAQIAKHAGVVVAAVEHSDG